MGLGSIFKGVANAFGAVGNYNQAKSDARWAIEEGRIKAQQEARDIKRLVATQMNSFVANGFELVGTPQAVMQDTINTGIEDIKALQQGYQKRASNMVKQARAQMYGGILGGVTDVVEGAIGLFGG